MDKLRRKPNFITVEGIDGVGKSTAVNVIAKRLHELGKNTTIVKQNRDTSLGQLVRTYIGDMSNVDANVTSLALLHSASLLDSIERIIEPAHLSGRIVISDRYTLSTRVYQQASKHIDKICSVVEATLSPDIIFLLDAPPRIVEARIDKRDEGTDIFEAVSPTVLNVRRKEFMRLVRNQHHDVHVIDASGTEQYVAEQIITILDRYYR